MTDVQALVRRAHDYAKKHDLKVSTVSRKLLGNGVRLSQLERGGSLRVDTLLRVERALAEMEQAA